MVSRNGNGKVRDGMHLVDKAAQYGIIQKEVLSWQGRLEGQSPLIGN